MAKKKMKLTRIENPRARNTAFKRRTQGLIKKAEELTILCGLDACLTFFNLDDAKLVAWPSKEVAESLVDRFYSLPSYERNMKAETQESFLKTNIKKIQKKLANCRVRVAELEMEHLLFDLENGRSLDDFSQSEIESLRSYTNKRIMGLNKDLGYSEHAYTSVNEPFPGVDQTPRVLDVALEQAHCSNLMGSRCTYLMDKWFFDDPKVQEDGDVTHLPKLVHRFDLNMEPSDDEEDMETYKGESGKSGGASDA
ncbi:hypothetical protein HID58_004072 [Brassica napus]|uniref:MADS-box domain-containing protein n=1 Tax=Brassica napus TaxID=3708 RepID=A0ABQ8E4Q5_BRANA|nr:MADS-box transcription factor PHERES 2-like [Brassica napus]KAH0936611.1 hypothetical protein HID58_004072 [Brassica napus]